MLLGGAPGAEPANVVIFGGGVVGENAAIIATGMKGKVYVVDKSKERLKELWNVGKNNSTSDKTNLKNCIWMWFTNWWCFNSRSRGSKLVTKEMIKSMKRGSVIVDVAIDHGVETSKPTTHANPTYVVDDVVHYCVSNMPGGVPRTTMALNKATLPLLIKIADQGYKKTLINKNFLAGLNIYKGHVTYKSASTFDLKNPPARNF